MGIFNDGMYTEEEVEKLKTFSLKLVAYFMNL